MQILLAVHTKIDKLQNPLATMTPWNGAGGSGGHVYFSKNLYLEDNPGQEYLKAILYLWLKFIIIIKFKTVIYEIEVN